MFRIVWSFVMLQVRKDEYRVNLKSSFGKCESEVRFIKLAMKSPSSQSVNNGVPLANNQKNGHLKSLDRQKTRVNKTGRIESANYHPPSNGKLTLNT